MNKFLTQCNNKQHVFTFTLKRFPRQEKVIKSFSLLPSLPFGPTFFYENINATMEITSIGHTSNKIPILSLNLDRKGGEELTLTWPTGYGI